MPSRDLVQAFIKVVEAGEYVRAIETFYAVDASMRENLEAPRRSLATLVKHEQAMLKRVEQIKAHPVERLLIDGDRVVINWVFDIMGLDGTTRRMDELAIQRWRGDKIVEEQFYYDPKPPAA